MIVVQNKHSRQLGTLILGTNVIGAHIMIVPPAIWILKPCYFLRRSDLDSPLAPPDDIDRDLAAPRPLHYVTSCPSFPQRVSSC